MTDNISVISGTMIKNNLKIRQIRSRKSENKLTASELADLKSRVNVTCAASLGTGKRTVVREDLKSQAILALRLYTPKDTS